MNKIKTILTFFLLWALGSCSKLADTYVFLHREVQWSFTQNTDEFTKHDKMRIFRNKTVNGTGNKRQLTLYNNSQENVDRMKAVFTQAKLWLNGKEITSGIPFETGEARQVTFSFEPDVKADFILIEFYAIVEGEESKYSTYHLKLLENHRPTAKFTYIQVKGLDYVFDASPSADEDIAMGDAISGCTYTVTDKRAKTIQTFTGVPGGKMKYTFPRKGEFFVDMVVVDQDMVDGTDRQEVTVNF